MTILNVIVQLILPKGEKGKGEEKQEDWNIKKQMHHLFLH